MIGEAIRRLLTREVAELFTVARSDVVPFLQWIAMAFLVAAAAATSAFGTTWGLVEKTCPIDGKLVRGRVPKSMFVPGSMPDFRPRGGGDPFFGGMLQCPHCGFHTHAERYDAPQGLDRAKVAEDLRTLDASSLFYPIDAALAVERCWGSDPRRIARLALTAKWLADDTGEFEVIRERLQIAIDAHKVLASQLKPGEEDYAATIYLVGELYRQQDNAVEAVRWFDKALPGADEYLARTIQQQRLAATHAGESPAKMIEKLKHATPAEQVAAIELLRSADDAETLQFLSDVVLKSPDQFREQAMQLLINGAPRQVHLPIYLKAIGDRHYRTVQGGAFAVELLRAREAAPLLVKALENPVEAADYRLAEALASVATPTEIPAMRRLFRDRTKQHFLFRALINTESSEAVDDVMKLLDDDAFFLGQADRPEGLRTLRSAARNNELLKRLPDLRTVAVDSTAVMFKTCVLALDDKPDSADELVAALNRDGELAFQAALALSKRRDPRGRKVLVDRLRDLLQQSHEGYLVLLPLLQPEDFVPIRRELDHEVAQHKEWLAELKRQLSEETDERQKARLLEQIAEQENRENWWMERWLRLLGATRHPDAKPLLFKYLDDPNHQARAGAIDGLGFCYDDEVGDRLLARLAVERDVPHVLVRVLGNSEDRRRLSSLLAVANKPTSVDTKTALIETLQGMQEIDRLKLKLESWSRSPNSMLAHAAKLALNGDRMPHAR